MLSKTEIALYVGFISLVLIATVGGIFIGALNNDANLRSRIEALQKSQEASFDTMRKVITSKRELPKAAKEDLLKLLPEVVSARSGGSLFKSVQEKYPDFNLSLYRDLSRTIEAQRNLFLTAQERLFDAKREHDALLRSPVQGTILSVVGRQPVEIVVVSSSLAKETVRTGVEDEY